MDDHLRGGQLNVSHNDYLFCTKIFWEAFSHCVRMCTYNFELCHMTAQMSHLYGFTKVIKFIAYIKITL